MAVLQVFAWFGIALSVFQLVWLDVQDKDMVSALLGLKVQLDTVLNQAFQKNEQFTNALKEAFEKFINQRQNK